MGRSGVSGSSEQSRMLAGRGPGLGYRAVHRFTVKRMRPMKAPVSASRREIENHRASTLTEATQRQPMYQAPKTMLEVARNCQRASCQGEWGSGVQGVCVSKREAYCAMTFLSAAFARAASGSLADRRARTR